MKLLANENFPLKSFLYLKNKGFDIVSIGHDYASITDKEVMSIAIKEKRTILTFDRDYGELIFKLNFKPECGVIYYKTTQFLIYYLNENLS
jgi:predicted nuclease of predicted toxin-antitoxin system